MENYSIANTTEDERRKNIETAIGLTNLGGAKPGKNFDDLAEKYIKGNIDIGEFLNAVDKSVKDLVNEYRKEHGFITN